MPTLPGIVSLLASSTEIVCGLGLEHALVGISHAWHLLDVLFDRVKAILSESSTMETPPRVAVIEWIDPLIPAGNRVREMIRMTGGRDALLKWTSIPSLPNGRRYRTTTWTFC
jgi:hypothetical protein